MTTYGVTNGKNKLDLKIWENSLFFFLFFCFQPFLFISSPLLKVIAFALNWQQEEQQREQKWCVFVWENFMFSNIKLNFIRENPTIKKCVHIKKTLALASLLYWEWYKILCLLLFLGQFDWISSNAVEKIYENHRHYARSLLYSFLSVFLSFYFWNWIEIVSYLWDWTKMGLNSFAVIFV